LKNPKQFYATFFSPASKQASRKDIFGLTSSPPLHLSGLGVRALVKKESAFSELMGWVAGV
jgi:hypothetical protein